MRYTINKNLIYALSVFCFVVLAFSLFANKANAQYYSASPANAPDYSYYRQMCPADYTFTVYNSNQYMCYKLFGGGQVLGASTINYNYNPVSSYSSILGCLPGYTYSQITGQRCDGNYYFSNGNLNAGNGDIRNFEVRDGDDSSLEEGDNDAEVIQVRFDVEDGDISLDKAEFNFEFTGNSNGEDLPWNTFDEIRLLSDGTEIAQMDTDNRSDWDEEDDNIYSLVFSGLDEIMRENDRGDLTLEVDLSSYINGAESGDISWDIFIPDNGLRVRNGDGDTIYAGDDSESATISIEEN